MAADFSGLSDEARNSLMPALDELRRAGIKFNVTSAYRSPEKQAALYANRASNPYPVAPPGHSTHEKGLAADVALTDEKQRDKATQILTSHGWSWRLGAKDRVHYEYDPKATTARIPAFNEKPAEYVPPFKPAKVAAAPDLIPAFKPAAAKAETIPDFIPPFEAPGRPVSPRVKVDKATGRVIDPVSGKPFPAKGTAVAGRQPGFDENLLEYTTALGVKAQKGYNRVLNQATAGLAPAREIANSVARELTASRKKYGRAENEPGSVAGMGVVWRGVVKSHPWKAFVNQLSKGEPTNLEAFHHLQDDPQFGPIIKKTPGGAATWDFVMSFPLDALSGSLQGKIVGAAGKGLAAADQKLGASEAVLNRVPALKKVVEGRGAYQQASQIMSRHAAGMDRYLRQAEDAAEDLRATSQKYGVGHVRGSNPFTHQPTNVVDQFVTEYLDAGNAGSKYEWIHPPSGPQVQKDADRAQLAYDILNQPKRTQTANEMRLAGSMLQTQKAAARQAEMTWSQAGEELLRELDRQKPLPKLPGSKPLLSPEDAIHEGQAAVETSKRVGGVIAAYKSERLAGEWASAERAVARDAARQAAAKSVPQAAEELKQSATLQDRLLLTLEIGLQPLRKQRAREFEFAASMERAQHEARNGPWSEAAGEILKEGSASKETPQLPAERPLLDPRAQAQASMEEATRQRLVQQVIDEYKAEVAGKEQTAAGLAQARRDAREAIERVNAYSAKKQAAVAKAGKAAFKETKAGRAELAAVDRGQEGAARREAELARVAQSAKASGIDPADIQRIADKYSKTMDTLGEHLVYYGLLKREAYEALRGQYLPRLYVLTKGDPEDVGGFLKLMEEQGAMTPEAIRAARQKLGPKGFAPSASLPAYTKSRELTDFSERNALELGRSAVPEATPAFTGYVAGASKAAGRAAGHAEIAATPNLALPVDQAPAGWVNYTGRGPLEGYAVHPAVDQLLKFQDDPGMVVGYLQRIGKRELAQKYQKLNSFVKRVWVSSPKTALNNIGGNVALGESTAAMHGANYTLPGYANAAKEMQAAAKGGKTPQLLQEALDHTSILRDSALQVPQGARGISSGFGVETRLERLKALPGKLFNAYGNTFYNLPEKAGRYYLYKELRTAGIPIEKAEKIVNDAMITYTDVGPIVRELERNPLFGAPFITFPLKAVATYAKTAALRPDKFHTYTGERLRQFLDQAADDARHRQGLEPVAARKRQTGEVGPFEFPIPGRNPEGKQGYLRAPGLAPFAQGLLSNRGGPPTENLLERLKGVNPLSNLVTGLATNENQFTGQPIVPVGSIPGTAGDITDIFRSGEAANKYGMQVVRAIFPQAGDIERLFKSATGTPEYESVGADVPSLQGSLLRAFTGIDTKATIGQNPLELQFRLKDRLEKLGGELTAEKKVATDYVQQMFANQRANGPDWVARPDFLQMAAKYDDKKLAEAAQNAEDRLFFVITREKGPDHQRKVKEMLDWLWALNIAQAEKKKEQAGFLTPEQRAPYAGMLGGR